MGQNSGKVWWYLEEAEAQYAFLVCKGLQHMLWLAQKKTAGCSFIVPGEVKEEKTAVIRVCILDCIRKLDFRLTNVTQHPGRAHTAAGVVEECRAGLRQGKYSSTSRCNQWSHLTLFGTLIYLCYSITAKANKGTEARPSKPSLKHQVRHTTGNSYMWGRLTCHATWRKIIIESLITD